MKLGDGELPEKYNSDDYMDIKVGCLDCDLGNCTKHSLNTSNKNTGHLRDITGHSQKTSTRNNNHHLTNPSLDEVSRIDGGDNPQDDPGKANVADNGDNGHGTFPADSKSKLDDKDS